MIITEKVTINLNRYTQHYIDKGYKIDGRFLEIYVKDLPIQSHVKVLVQCDNCGDQKETRYYNYNESTKGGGLYYCNKCKKIKTEKTNLKKSISKKITNPIIQVKPIIKKESPIKIIKEVNIISDNSFWGIEDDNNEVYDFIKSNYFGNIVTSNNNTEIYLPDLNLEFDYNSLHLHCELFKNSNYHRNKSDLCDQKGIRLIHIWEDDWLLKKDISKSMILNKLGITPNKIFARKCEIRVMLEKDNSIVKKFLDNSHIQGSIGSFIKIGLFYQDELVSLMTFGKKRKFMNSSSKEGEWELLRFCNKINTNVVGGASRLFQYFIKNYEYTEITTYADRSHSDGSLYKILGFEFIDKTEPNYYYIIDGVRKHRFGFRKDALIKDGYDATMTEHEIMLGRGINRIFNAGNLKFKLSFQTKKPEI